MSGIEQTRLLQLRSTIVNQNSALKRAVGDIATDGLGRTSSSFGELVNDAIQKVNAQQTRATDISAAYERGETNDIVSVMIERQKASIGFETTLQVRNKLLSAYRDIMNMPV